MVSCQRRKLRLRRLTTHKLWYRHLKPDPLTSNQTVNFLVCYHEGECSRKSPICTIARSQRTLGTVSTVADLISHLPANPTRPPSSEGSTFIINPTILYGSKYHIIKFNKPLPRSQGPQNISEGNSSQLLRVTDSPMV